MIRLSRCRVLLGVLAVCLVGLGCVAWIVTGLPPPKYFLRYGLDPYCEPTGERVTLEGVEFVEIGPGIFRMGSTFKATGGDWLGKLCKPLGLPWGKHPKMSSEMPVHWVEFRRGFWIATTEITNAQYELFRPENRRSELSAGEVTPVSGMSFDDAKDYCAWLSRKAGHPIRLPSEAEWECSCRAGSVNRYSPGDDDAELSQYAWFGLGLADSVPPVGTKRPNRWGLFDLHGSVWELCEDTWHDSYDNAPSDGSPWVEDGATCRVVRGGCWSVPAEDCRSASRRKCLPIHYSWYVGFRPAFSNPDD